MILSGVLVVFTYIVRLIPNERFEYIGLVVILFVMLLVFFIWEIRNFGWDEGFSSMKI